MFGLDDLLKKVDLGDILSKFNLGDKEKEEVKVQAADALNYRVNKEKKRGNEKGLEELLASKDNTGDADSMAKKLEGDLAFNLKNKSKMDESLIDKIKSEVMSRFLGGATGAAKEKGEEDGKGLMGLFGGDNLVGNLLGDKLKGLF